MDRNSEIREITRRRTRRNLLKRSLALLCAVVLLFTMNTLKRNANTLERIPTCGLAEHMHTEACYADGELVCGLQEHVHTDACYQQAPPSGGKAEVVADAAEEAAQTV